MDGGLKVAGRHTRIVWVPEREEHAITAPDALIPQLLRAGSLDGGVVLGFGNSWHTLRFINQLV